MERAISAWLQPCLLSAASIYLSAGESWRYDMANILFVAVENLRQYHGSLPSQGSLLHLVYESAEPNKGMEPTGMSEPLIENLSGFEDASRRLIPGVRLLRF